MKHWSFKLFLAFLALNLLVVGCSSDDSGSTGGDDPDACDGVTCGDNAHCEEGVCVCDDGFQGDADTACEPIEDPCDGVECGEEEICVDGECVPDDDDPCKDVVCDEGEFCFEGECVVSIEACEGVECGENAYCVPDTGECACDEGYEGNPDEGCTPIPEGCEDVTCGDNAHCEAGECFCDEGYEGDPNAGCTEIVNPCDGVICGDNAHCEEGVCVCDPGFEGDADAGCTAITCDHKMTGLALGFACNLDSECDSGLCANTPSGARFCTMMCAEGDCPERMVCAADEEFGMICQTETPLPGDASHDMYNPCNLNGDCAGDMCLAKNDITFCTTDCAADPDICGACGFCFDASDIDGINTHVCIPFGQGDVGASCAYDLDCEEWCFDGYCSEECTFARGEGDSCPDGFTCREITDWQMNLCVDDAQAGLDLDALCEYDWQCASEMCIDIAGDMRCGQSCAEEACPDGFACITKPGDTVENTDTEITLFDEASEELATNDDLGQGNYFSMIEFAFEAAGTYRLKVAPSSYWEGDPSVPYTHGMYYLEIVQEGDTPSETDEAEPNNTADEAQTLTLPARIVATLDETGADEDWYEFEIAEPGAYTIVTSPADEMLCIAEEHLGGTGFGEACVEEYQCSDDPAGLTCHLDACTLECDTDEDCPNGICFAYDEAGEDKWCVAESMIGTLALGEACDYGFECDPNECFYDGAIDFQYCSGACESADDCALDMGCFDGQCILSTEGSQGLYSICRLDDDCAEGNMCIDYHCASGCAETDECVGSTPIEVVDGMMCAPCETDEDCEQSDAVRYCADMDGASVCITDCTDDPTLCPEGTECIEYNYFDIFIWSECTPISGSCTGTSVCTDAGYCQVPQGKIGSMCDANSDCQSGLCEAGFCSEECVEDADCGCELFVCGTGGTCEIALSPDVLAEAEPNDALDTAQELSAFPISVFASLKSNRRAMGETDLYKVSLSAGDVMNVETKGVCGETLDTNLRILNEAGELYGEAWENNNISQDNLGSRISLFSVEEATVVYIEVTQSSLNFMELTGAYFLDVDVFQPAANDSCDGAMMLEAGEHALEIANALNTYDLMACTEETASDGPDLAYAVTIPAGSYLEATLDAPFDAAIALVSDCADIEAGCLAGSDFTNPEHLIYLNTTEADVEAKLIVDSKAVAADMSFTLTLAVEEIVVPANDTAETAELIETPGPTEVTGTLIGATDDYNPVEVAEGACAGYETTGGDVVYRFEIGQNQIATVSFDDTLFVPVAYFASDPAALESCLEFSTGSSLTYINRGEAMEVYLILDSMDPREMGAFAFTLEVMEIPAGDSCADPVVVETLPAFFEGDTSVGFTDFFSNAQSETDGQCNSYGAAAADVVYAVDVPDGAQLDAILTPLDVEFDAALYLLGACEFPYAPDACLANDDSGLGGEEEVVTWVNETGGAMTVYLVVDGYTPLQIGSFTLDIEVN